MFKKIIKFFAPGVSCQYGPYMLPLVTSTRPMPKCKPARDKSKDISPEQFKIWFDGYSAGVELPAILIEKVKNLRNPITL